MDYRHRLLSALHKTTTREFLLRTLQYAAFTVSSYRFSPYSKQSPTRRLYLACSLVRKVLRLGTPAVLLVKMLERAHQVGPSRLGLLCDLLQLVFCLLDHAVLAQRVGLWKSRARGAVCNVEMLRNVLWAVHSVVAVCTDATSIHRTNKLIEHLVRLTLAGQLRQCTHIHPAPAPQPNKAPQHDSLRTRHSACIVLLRP